MFLLRFFTTLLVSQILAEGPSLDGWPYLDPIVMRSGHPDMRRWQDVVESVETAQENAEQELEYPPDTDQISSTLDSRRRRFVIDKPQLRWTNAVIPYMFDPSVNSVTRRHIEADIFGLFEYWTHFRFVPWNSSVPEMYHLGHTNYLIFVEYNSACWSYSGNNVILKGQKISCCKFDRCIHELGHVIGFYHEISNPLRDEYIKINYENIMDGMEPNFEKISPNKQDIRVFGYYDMSSVMGYDTEAFSKNYRETTTVLDPELQYLTWQKDVTAYYMFYEAQLLYDMKGQMCPDNTMECRNGGYLSYVNGSCRCRCPEGLDYMTGCTTTDRNMTDCGGVIELSSIKKSVYVTTPGYPEMLQSRANCVWFIKGPPGSRLVLDFSDFYIPKGDLTEACNTYIEVRFAMPGQPGVRYCGDGFDSTVVSQDQYLALSLGTTLSDSTALDGKSIFGRFAASVRLVEEGDMCYTAEGKDGSYQGKVNYGRNFEKCIPWDQATNCTFNTFNVTWMGLEADYCRNPGHGTRPWCYTNAKTCDRVYCDVCQLRKCRDLFDDCIVQIGRDPGYCSQDPEASRGCRMSCGLCETVEKPNSVSSISCSLPPPVLLDGELIPDNKLVYQVGDIVTYRCNKNNDTTKRNVTCTSEGTWTYIGYVCSENTTCGDQRTDCQKLLEETPTMCIEYREFSWIKCAHTCSLCTQASGTEVKHQCKIFQIDGNVTEVSQGPYYSGNFVQYSCSENHVLLSGDLTRACRNNGTFTGKPPRCIAEEDAITDLYHVELKHRKFASASKMVYTFSNNYYKIQRRGQIESWQFYSIISGKVIFQVWRQAGITNSYKLIGTNYIDDTLDDRLVTVKVPESDRISVEPGDFVGLQTDSTNAGGIAYDRCTTNYNPEGGSNHYVESDGPLIVGQYYTMKPSPTCRLFSVSAKIGPPKVLDLKALTFSWRNFLYHHGFYG